MASGSPTGEPALDLTAQHSDTRLPLPADLGPLRFEDRAGAKIGSEIAHADEARPIAANIAKLPDLVGKARRGDDEATH